jgi:hypothetical protein
MPAAVSTRSVPEGLPAIPKSQRVDWCTSEPVLEVVSQILPEIGIDPASNENSIVPAKHSVCLPDGAALTDLVGGLAAPWHKHKTFFINPPFGADVIPLWVKKAIAEAELGAEGIMLLPAYVSAYFFDALWTKAQVICFWGRPGVTSSRVKFRGAKDSATFPIMLVYFGTRFSVAADYLERVGQIVPPFLVRSWMRMIRGQVIPTLCDQLEDVALQDPIYGVLRREHIGQYDELIVSAAGVRSKTIAELIAEEHPLVEDLLRLKAGEIGGALAALQRAEVRPRKIPTRNRKRVSRSPRGAQSEASSAVPTPQLDLLPQPSKREQVRNEIDKKIISGLRDAGDDGLLSKDLRARVGCSRYQFQRAIERLTKAAYIFSNGPRIYLLNR